jgi:hypothetical protein
VREVNLEMQGYGEEDEDLFNLPSMASIKDAVNKGVDAIRGTTSSSDRAPRRAIAGRGSDGRPRQDVWEDWDDDDNW